jgi:hypothetical protein
VRTQVVSSFYWQKPSHIAWQFEQELKEKEKKRIKKEEDMLKKEKDRLKKEEIERLDIEILELKNLRKRFCANKKIRTFTIIVWIKLITKRFIN